ncbi:hypothetical protein N9D07_03505 [Alphaproteobacteria bacterium]|nr:hypothetical protein [Alphaproteobacteria bacterium]
MAFKFFKSENFAWLIGMLMQFPVMIIATGYSMSGWLNFGLIAILLAAATLAPQEYYEKKKNVKLSGIQRVWIGYTLPFSVVSALLLLFPSFQHFRLL